MRRHKPFPIHIIVFLAPAVIIYTLFMVYPLLDSLGLSLRSSARTGNAFVGLENYRLLLTDPQLSERLWNAIRNNLVFFAIHMLVQNPIGLLLASLLSSRAVRFKAFFRTALFLPTILSIVLVGFIWRLILSPLWGISGDALDLVGLGSLNRPWLGLESSALVTLSLVSVWQYIGIPMLLFLAALLGIPEELDEAARVDGATAWQTFWRIRFPLILPTVGVVGVLTFVSNFNAFDLIYTTQRALAGPNFSTDILGTFFFRTFFGAQLQTGDPVLGAAVAGVMFFIILLGVLLYFFGFARRVRSFEL